MELDFPHHYEALGDRTLCVTPDHKFGTDAFLLSDFAAPRRKDLACDLGTGCGIIPMLWFRRPEDAPKLAFGVDIQQKAIGPADRLGGEKRPWGKAYPHLRGFEGSSAPAGVRPV